MPPLSPTNAEDTVKLMESDSSSIHTDNRAHTERMKSEEEHSRFHVVPAEDHNDGGEINDVIFSTSVLNELIEEENRKSKELKEQYFGPPPTRNVSFSRYSPSHKITIVNITNDSKQHCFISSRDRDMHLIKPDRSKPFKCCLLLALGLVLSLVVVLIISTITLNINHGHHNNHGEVLNHLQDGGQNSTNVTVLNVTSYVI